MATIPTLTYLPSDENVILQLISRPLPADADLFDVADNCAALVSVLVETDDATSRTALCERLLQALRRLRKLCDVDLPPHLIEQLIMGEKLNSCVAGLLAGHPDSGGLCSGADASGDGGNAARSCSERANGPAARYGVAAG